MPTNLGWFDVASFEVVPDHNWRAHCLAFAFDLADVPSFVDGHAFLEADVGHPSVVVVQKAGGSLITTVEFHLFNRVSFGGKSDVTKDEKTRQH